MTAPTLREALNNWIVEPQSYPARAELTYQLSTSFHDPAIFNNAVLAFSALAGYKNTIIGSEGLNYKTTAAVLNASGVPQSQLANLASIEKERVARVNPGYLVDRVNAIGANIELGSNIGSASKPIVLATSQSYFDLAPRYIDINTLIAKINAGVPYTNDLIKYNSTHHTNFPNNPVLLPQLTEIQTEVHQLLLGLFSSNFVSSH